MDKIWVSDGMVGQGPSARLSASSRPEGELKYIKETTIVVSFIYFRPMERQSVPTEKENITSVNTEVSIKVSIGLIYDF